MTTEPIPSQPAKRYLRTPEAARMVGLSPRTLEKHRTFGTGPTYLKLGGRILYTAEDLQRWIDRGVRSSTSDEGQGTVFPARKLSDTERSANH